MSVGAKSIHEQAESLLQNCRVFLQQKQERCKEIVRILTSHPDSPEPAPQSDEFSDSDYSETLSRLESQIFSDLGGVDVESEALLAKGSPSKGRVAQSKSHLLPPEDKASSPSKMNVFLKKEYEKLFKSIKTKWHKLFGTRKPENQTKNDIIEILMGMEELEFNLSILEKAMKSLEEIIEQPEESTDRIKQKMSIVSTLIVDSDSNYKIAVDFNLRYNRELKEYVHERLHGAQRATVEDHRKSRSPRASGSREKSHFRKASRDKSSSKTPPRWSGRAGLSSADATEDATKPTSSKIASKQQKKKKNARDKKMYKTQSRVETKDGHPVKSTTREDRDVGSSEQFESAGGSSRDTISTVLGDSVEDLPLSDSEDSSDADNSFPNKEQ